MKKQFLAHFYVDYNFIQLQQVDTKHDSIYFKFTFYILYLL